MDGDGFVSALKFYILIQIIAHLVKWVEAEYEKLYSTGNIPFGRAMLLLGVFICVYGYNLWSSGSL